MCLEFSRTSCLKDNKSCFEGNLEALSDTDNYLGLNLKQALFNSFKEQLTDYKPRTSSVIYGHYYLSNNKEKLQKLVT